MNYYKYVIKVAFVQAVTVVNMLTLVAINCSTVVEHSPHYPHVKGLSTVVDVDSRGVKIVKNCCTWQ